MILDDDPPPRGFDFGPAPTPYDPAWIVPIDPTEDEPAPPKPRPSAAALTRMVYGPQPLTGDTLSIIAEWSA